jgi:two-component system sensor histidine kinase KdpD
MSPGVGKTFKMLEEAHQLKRDGVDVVIGLLETHGRKETAEKAEGLELVPRQKITHSGVTLTEMDTDAVIARQPQLALIDELVHTNLSLMKDWYDLAPLLSDLGEGAEG